MEQQIYPLIQEGWARTVSQCSDLELLVAHRRGYLLLDSATNDLGDRTDGDIEEDIALFERSSQNIEILRDKYFGLLLINLYENWFSLKRPLMALEFLVLDFVESPLVRVWDKMLPSGIAGISETTEVIDRYNLDEYRIKVSFHKWLGDYIVAMLEQDVVRKPALM